jgi:hypothetical protein
MRIYARLADLALPALIRHVVPRTIRHVLADPRSREIPTRALYLALNFTDNRDNDERIGQACAWQTINMYENVVSIIPAAQL